jgi:DNA-binding transcriptional MerR regulator
MGYRATALLRYTAVEDKKGIAEAARAVPCPEGTLRRLDRKGIIRPARDQWGRRLFGQDDIEAARCYLRERGATREGAAA